jgi:hypothetical protein
VRPGELDEAVNQVDGGAGFAASGGYLDEGTALVGSEAFFEVADGFDLRRPQIRRGHLVRSRDIREASVELVFGLEVLEQRLGFVEGENVATFRRRIVAGPSGLFQIHVDCSYPVS